MKTSFLQGPNLNTNVNTNSGYSGFGQILMNDAARGLNLNERKRRTNLYNAYKDKSLNQRQSNADRNYNLQKEMFDNRVNTNNRDFNYKKTRNEIKDKQWRDIFNNRVSKENKPSYTPISTLNNDGTPTIKLFDRNSGSFKDTQITPYVKSKQTSPEREAYYQARKEELNQKRINNMIKSLDLQYPEMGEDEKLRAINYINQHGVMPIIKNHKGWFGGNNFIVQMDNKQKQKEKDQLEKDMKLLGL